MDSLSQINANVALYVCMFLLDSQTEVLGSYFENVLFITGYFHWKAIYFTLLPI